MREERMKLVYKPFESMEEAKQCKEFKKACKKDWKEFKSDINNIGRLYFPLLISPRLLVSEEEAKKIKKRKQEGKKQC